MGMTITDIVKELQKWRDSFAYDWGDYCIGDSGTKHALDTAVETIRKYQKIQEIYERYQKDGDYYHYMAWLDVMEVLKDGNDN